MSTSPSSAPGSPGITAAVAPEAGRQDRRAARVEADRPRRDRATRPRKVTSGHGAGLHAISQEAFGEEGARIYAEANQAALERIAQFVEEDGIDCDFERKDNYVYAGRRTGGEQRSRQEVEAAQAAGPARVTRPTRRRCPYRVAAAVRLENQAQFHPRKYLLALAATIPGDGSHVFEQTMATDSVKHGEPVRRGDRPGPPCARRTSSSRRTCRSWTAGFFFARAHPHRSYACRRADRPDGRHPTACSSTRARRRARCGRFATASGC